jgi:hypothetical protein
MRLRISLLCAACALALAACTPQSRPTPSPTASAGATPAASPSAAVQPTPLVLPADAPPQIVAVELSDPVFHSGERVSGTVITSTNVTTVEVRVANQQRALPETAPGIFSMSYTMPKIPFFLRGTYVAHIIALSGSGASAEKDVSVSLR